MRKIYSGFVFMVIMLIVFMPVSFAYSIGSVYVYGENGIEGYRKGTDYTEFSIEILKDSGEEDVTIDQLEFETGLAFNGECTVTADGIFCTHRTPSQRLEEDELDYSIILKNKHGSPVDYQDAKIVIDSEGPYVKTATVVQKENTGEVLIDLVAVDDAYADSNEEGICGGLKEVKVEESGNVLFQKNDFSDNVCVFELDNHELSVTGSGTKTFVITLTDRFGRTKASARTINVDKAEPSYDDLYIYRGDDDLSYVLPDTSYTVDAELVFVSSDPIYVDASFNDFNQYSPQQEKTGSCTPALGDRYVCRFSDISLNVASSRTVHIEFTATDSFGNVLSHSDTYQITADGTGPMLSDFTTVPLVEDSKGDLYVGSKASFWIYFMEDGAGVSPDDVFLIADAFTGNLADAKVSATECNDDYCYWNLTSRPDLESAQVSIHADSEDVLGNYFESPQDFSRSLIVNGDLDFPVLEGDIEVSMDGESLDYYMVGDEITITAAFSDSGVGVDKDNVWANLSLLLPSVEGLHQGVCEDGESESQVICTWDVGPLEDIIGDTERPGIESFDLIAYDLVGNYLVEEGPEVTVYLRGESDIDDWKRVIIADGDYLFDRQILAMMGYSQDIPLIIADRECVNDYENEIGSDYGCGSRMDNLELVDSWFVDDSCKVVDTSDNDGSENVDQGYVNLFEDDPDSRYNSAPVYIQSPGDDRLGFAEVAFKKSDVPNEVDWIVYNCTLELRSHKRGRLYSEKESVIFNVSFIASRFGTVEDAAEAELANARERAGGAVMGFIDSAASFIEGIQSLCSIYSSISNFLLIFGAIRDMIHGGPFVEALGQSFGAGLEATKGPFLSTLDQYVIPVCRFVNCEHCQSDSDSSWMGTSSRANLVELDENSCEDAGFFTQTFDDDPEFDLCKAVRGPLCQMTVGASTSEGLDNFAQGTADALNIDTSVDPKTSFGLSLLTLCIPGILSGVKNMRHIECKYIRCLESGENPYLCKAQKSSQVCYWWGEGLSFLLYMWGPTKIMKVFQEAIEDVMMNPIRSGLGILFKTLCGGPCVMGTGCGECVVVQLGTTFLNALNSVWNLVENWEDDMLTSWTESPCDGLFDEEEDAENPEAD
ncbi:MAG: hypothetical protein ACLFUO_03620 [Candidatus Woesearchaeota archaeon]